MGTQRNAWHYYFAIMLHRYAPVWIEVRDEVPLSEERPRLDFLLLRKTAPVDTKDPGQMLFRLWTLLGPVTIVEFKSIGRPYRQGDLDRLWGYVHLYYADENARPAQRNDLRAVLIVPARSQALAADVDAMRLRWKDLGGGYWQLKGGLFTLFVVELDEVAKQEQEDLVSLLSHHKRITLRVRRFWGEMVGTREARMSVQDMEGYDEVMQHLLSSFTPEERLAGLTPEQTILALPDEMLRGFSEDYLATFPEPIRAAIRRRLRP